jgi:hypothetical protein
MTTPELMGEVHTLNASHRIQAREKKEPPKVQTILLHKQQWDWQPAQQNLIIRVPLYCAGL